MFSDFDFCESLQNPGKFTSLTPINQFMVRGAVRADFYKITPNVLIYLVCLSNFLLKEVWKTKQIKNFSL